MRQRATMLDARVQNHGRATALAYRVNGHPDGSHRRQRFSLGHEPGHRERHRGQILMCQSDDVGGNNRRAPKEAAADRFAADLLMPGFLL